MNEKLSYTEYVVVGSPRQYFDIGFEDYQEDKDMLKLTVDNKDVTEAGYSVVRNVGQTLEFTPAVPVGAVVRIQRVTDIDAPFYIFTAGNAFVPSNVDANFKQLLHSQQEVRDRQDHLEERVIPVVDGLEEALKIAEDAAKDAQEAKDAAEEAAQTTRSASNVIDASGLTQQQVNDKSSTTVKSIADLIAIKNPKDGQVVYVKGYYLPTNFALAQPFKGGGTRVYVESRKEEDDGFLCVKGWVIQLESEIYTPYMSGCKCDGVTDDTLNLDKLMYALEVNNLSGKLFIEDDMFFNNQCPLTGKLTYGMNFNDGLPVIRLVDNVDIEIKSTLKFGSFYDDKNIAVFNAKYQESAEDWLGKKHYNINIFGGGVLDFTAAGIMRTGYRNRICFSLANCTNSSVHNLTVKGGDFMNTIVTTYRGYGVDIHHMTFIDQMSDVGKSYDHSTMYLIAENCNVYANEFISNSIKSRINACAVEFHGNNQHMYGNKVFIGYRNAVFVAAYKLGHEGVDDTYRGNITIKDNTAQVTTFFKLWTDSVLKIGEINCENNIQNVAPFLNRADAIAGGVDAAQYDNLPLIAHFFGTETDQNAYNFPDSPDAKIVIKNNQYYGGVSGYGKDLFMYTPLIMRDGLDIQYNTIKARQLFILEDDRGLLQPLIMRNFKFKNNNIVWTAIYDRIAITTQPVALQNCEIDVNVDFTFATTLTENDSMFWIDLRANQSWNNNFKFTSDAYTKIKKWVGGNITSQNRDFYSYNSLVYDTKVAFSYFQEVGVKSVVLYTSDANICKGVKSVFAHSYLSASEITLVLPTTFQKDMRIDAVHNQVCAMSYYVTSPQTGTLSMYCRVHS